MHLAWLALDDAFAQVSLYSSPYEAYFQPDIAKKELLSMTGGDQLRIFVETIYPMVCTNGKATEFCCIDFNLLGKTSTNWKAQS